MKNLFVFFFLFWSVCAQAQPPNLLQERMQQRKAEIEEAKREIITTRINLKPEQEKNFWEVYDKYTLERISLRKKITRLRRTGFSMAATDAELEKSFDDLIALRQKEVDADKNYKTLLLKIINIRQLSELYRLEHEYFKRVLEIVRDRQPNRPPPPHHKRDDDGGDDD
jgi:5'-deoxynucleotidase YfbR-like HD superfamily hydrolase